MSFPYQEGLTPPAAKEHQIGPNSVGMAFEGLGSRYGKNEVVSINVAPLPSQTFMVHN